MEFVLQHQILHKLRKIHDFTKNDSYPLPKVGDTLAVTKWLFTIDLQNGYCQVDIADEDEEKLRMAI